MKLIIRITQLSFLILAAAMAASANSIWLEVNAGAQLANADITAGLGPLTGIIGALSNQTLGADMYEIYILDPEAFSATTIGNGNKPAIDPALYLFDSGGHGLFGNDNISNGNKQAQIPLGTTDLLTAGRYYLLIAPSGHLPETKTGSSIFGAITGTTGIDIGSGVLKQYGGTPSGDDSGKGYQIQLTGAGFAIPEPSSTAFAILGILSLACCSFRVRRGSH